MLVPPTASDSTATHIRLDRESSILLSLRVPAFSKRLYAPNWVKVEVAWVLHQDERHTNLVERARCPRRDVVRLACLSIDAVVSQFVSFEAASTWWSTLEMPQNISGNCHGRNLLLATERASGIGKEAGEPPAFALAYLKQAALVSSQYNA